MLNVVEFFPADTQGERQAKEEADRKAKDHVVSSRPLDKTFLFGIAHMRVSAIQKCSSTQTYTDGPRVIFGPTFYKPEHFMSYGDLRLGGRPAFRAR